MNTCACGCGAQVRGTYRQGHNKRKNKRLGPGDVVADLTVVADAGSDDWGARVLRCTCRCGRETWVREASLNSGTTRSCGCLFKATAAENGKRGAAKMRGPRPEAQTHGHSNPPSPTYFTWASMIARCTYPNTNGYPNYGGRGIKVCDRWHTFAWFLADMGERPRGKTLDRMNNDGDYEPSNCRWASKAEQTANRRVAHA